MKPAEDRRLLPHEIAFGAFLAVTWARLVAVEGPLGGHACFYLALLGVNALAVLCAPWRLRLLFHPVAMNLLFWSMGSTVGVFHPGKTDLLLADIDRAFLGTNLSVRLQPCVTPALTDLMSFCYLLFFPYLALSMITAFCGDLETLKRHSAGLFTIYGIGFFGYTLLPAIGPYSALKDQFVVPLEGGFLTRWNAALVQRGTTGVDVFPSLHCAVTCYLLFFDFRHNRRRFWIFLLPCAGLWLSTIYLRYHYAVDIAAGFALSALALAIALWKGAPRDLPAQIS